MQYIHITLVGSSTSALRNQHWLRSATVLQLCSATALQLCSATALRPRADHGYYALMALWLLCFTSTNDLIFILIVVHFVNHKYKI